MIFILEDTVDTKKVMNEHIVSISVVVGGPNPDQEMHRESKIFCCLCFSVVGHVIFTLYDAVMIIIGAF